MLDSKEEGGSGGDLAFPTLKSLAGTRCNGRDNI